jgi:hypothetical protein
VSAAGSSPIQPLLVPFPRWPPARPRASGPAANTGSFQSSETGRWRSCLPPYPSSQDVPVTCRDAPDHVLPPTHDSCRQFRDRTAAMLLLLPRRVFGAHAPPHRGVPPPEGRHTPAKRAATPCQIPLSPPLSGAASAHFSVGNRRVAG